jgi:hypothetical protein
MKRSTSMIPTIVFYTDYSDCCIADALLSELKRWPLTLPQIGNIRVNGYRLLGSYWKNIQNLRKLGYKIDTIVTQKNGHTESVYILQNKNFNPVR